MNKNKKIVSKIEFTELLRDIACDIDLELCTKGTIIFNTIKEKENNNIKIEYLLNITNEEANPWINVYDKAPYDGQVVLTYFKPTDSIEINKHTITKYGSCFSNDNGFLTDEEVWWLPIPKLPNI